MSEYQKLVDEIVDSWWRTGPVSASFSGEHGHDHELDDLSREFTLSSNQEQKRLLHRLEQLGEAELTADERIDRRLLIDAIAAGVRLTEEYRMWEKNPAGPIQTGLHGTFVLALREFAPLAQRAEAMLSRLRQVPRALDQGRSALKDSPAVFTRVALEVARGGVSFYQGFVPMIADQVPALKTELLAAARDAAAAVEAYARFLEQDWLPRSAGSFALGRELFDYMLRVQHGLPYDADDIVEIATDLLAETEAALAQLAETLAPGRPWWEVVDESKHDHPAGAELIQAYRREMLRARDFTREHGLVTIPDGEELELIWTPAFDRSTIPYAAYMAPAPLEPAQKGFFYVTPVNAQLTPEQQDEQLAGHSYPKITVTALHEAYPGHHLQLVLANRHSSKLRRLLGTSVMVEGWALYCEELMYEKGFYDDPRVRLMQLKDQVWRCCRVLIDVGLHTAGMTFDQAVAMLVNRARVEPVNAEAEVKRYCASPTQPMSYIVGKHQITALRRESEADRGARFDLREFHDRLLSYGSIPVAVIRAAMGTTGPRESQEGRP